MLNANGFHFHKLIEGLEHFLGDFVIAEKNALKTINLFVSNANFQYHIIPID